MSEFICQKCNPPKALASIINWKNHNTRVHGGYSESDLLQVQGIGNDEGIHIMGEGTFEDFAGKMPETATGFVTPERKVGNTAGSGDAGAEQRAETGEGSSAPPAPEVQQMPPKMRAEMNKIKKAVSQKIPRMIFRRVAIAKKDQAWELTRDEEKELGDSFEMILACLGIDFQITQINYTLTSPLWLLVYPLFTLFLIILGKQGETIDAEPDDSDNSTEGTRENASDFAFPSS